MKIFEFEQYSPSWWAERRGVPTASEFSCILTAKTMKLSAAHRGYIHRLIGDVYDLEYPRMDDRSSAPMRRGTGFEPESRAWYEMEKNVEVRQVGFCKTDDDRFGCSPDGLVGDDGVLELKNPMPATQAEYILDGELPADYRAQVHGQLIVTGRAWCDFISYCPGFPALCVRVTPDDYTEALRKALDEFYGLYQAALGRIRELDGKGAA